MPPGRHSGQAHAVLLGLCFNAHERRSFGLRLNRPNRAPIHEQQIIGVTRLQWKLLHGHIAPRAQIHLTARLHDPAALGQQCIDILSGQLFGVGISASKPKTAICPIYPDAASLWLHSLGQGPAPALFPYRQWPCFFGLTSYRHTRD